MNILVTGGAGFIGSHIVDLFLKEAHNVLVVDNLSSGKTANVNPKAKLIKMDVRDPKIRQLIIDYKIEVIDHHAAQISVRNSVENPLNDAENNIFGILNILEVQKQYSLKKIIFASSGGAVYGEASIIPTPENFDPWPLSPYGVAKLASEKYLFHYFKNFNVPYIALRYSNVYGPRQDPFGEAGVVAIFCKKMISNSVPVINGDGRQTRDYVFVKDVARANLNALNTDFCGHVNIGTGKETSVNDLANEIKEEIKYQGEIRHGPAKLGEQTRSCLQNLKAQEVLNWRPECDLKVGIRETVEYFKTK